MLSLEKPILNTLTPKIKLLYSDTKLVSETEYCQTFDAVSKCDNEQYTIRTLKITSGFYKENSEPGNNTIHSFFRLCTTHPESIIIESFESHDRGQFAYAMKHCRTLQGLVEKIKSGVLKEINFDLLLKNVMSDVKFLLEKLRISQTINIELPYIYQFDKAGGYFLSDWARSIEKDVAIGRITTTLQRNTSDGANEVHNFGLKILDLGGIPRKELEAIMETNNVKLYNAGLDILLEQLNHSEMLKKTLRKMLEKNPENRVKLDSLIQKGEAEGETALDKPETKNEKNMTDPYSDELMGMAICDTCMAPVNNIDVFENKLCSHKTCIYCLQEIEFKLTPLCILRKCSKALDYNSFNTFIKEYEKRINK